MQLVKDSYGIKYNKNLMKKFCEETGWICGRMVAGSKSSYDSMYPNNKVYYNANIFLKSGTKIFYGDVDLTKDSKILKSVAKKLKIDFVVTRECPARFDGLGSVPEDNKVYFLGRFG